ncbi:MAG: hypothetical protein WAT47_13900 [Nostocoides sp.]
MRAKREALGHAPAVLTIYLVITLLFLETTTLAPHRIWSVIAAVGYAITLILSSSRLLRGWIGTLTLLGTAIVPLAILSAAHVWQPEVQVLVDGARYALETGTPYLAHPESLSEYRPYMPLMFAFGVPRALGLEGLLGDPRVLMTSVYFGLLFSAAILTDSADGNTERPRIALPEKNLLLLSFPLLSLSLSVSAIDAPMTGLCVLAIAAYGRHKLAMCAVASALAMALKPTAALFVLIVALTVWRRVGVRPCSGYLLRVAIVWTLCISPTLAFSVSALWGNVVAFPTGQTEVPSPAQSPFPGVLLSGLGDTGRLLAIALVAITVFAALLVTWIRPPVDVRTLSIYVALAFSVLFLVAPNSRAGYFFLPMVVWITFINRMRL